MVASLKKCRLPGLARLGLWQPPSKTDEAARTRFSDTFYLTQYIQDGFGMQLFNF